MNSTTLTNDQLKAIDAIRLEERTAKSALIDEFRRRRITGATMTPEQRAEYRDRSAAIEESAQARVNAIMAEAK